MEEDSYNSGSVQMQIACPGQAIAMHYQQHNIYVGSKKLVLQRTTEWGLSPTQTIKSAS